MAQRTVGRLVILGALILLIWFGAAALAALAGIYPSFGEGVWRVLWHMLDPGALGDDLSTAQRVLGVALTLTGLVILVGVILTVFAEALDRAMERLGDSDPPVNASGHLLVVGSNDILPATMRQLSLEARAQGRTAPETVVLLPPDQRETRDNLKRRLKTVRQPGDQPLHVIGGDLDGDGLDRAAADDATGVVVLSDDGTPDTFQADLGVIEAGATLAERFAGVENSPPVALQMRTGRNVDAIWRAFPAEFDALVEDRAVGAMMMATLLNPSFAETILGTDPTTGDEGRIAIRPGVDGERFGSLTTHFEGERPIGIMRGERAEAEAMMIPSPDYRLGEGERLITVLDGRSSDGDQPSGDESSADRSTDWTGAAPRIDRIPARIERLLIVGWSPAAECLTRELSRPLGLTDLTVICPTAPPGLLHEVEGLSATHLSGRLEDPLDLQRAYERSAPQAVIVASTRGEESRAAFAALHLDRLLSKVEQRPPLLAEQPSGEGATRLRSGLQHATVISGAELIGITIAESALNPELVIAREAMVDSQVARLDRFRVDLSEGESLDLHGLHHTMVERGAVPLGVARDRQVLEFDRGLSTPIVDGDEVLGVTRLADPSGRTHSSPT